MSLNFIITKDIPKSLKKILMDLVNWSRNIPGSALKNNSVSLGKLKWQEWHIPLVLPATVYQTTSTSEQNLGAYFQWDPNKFPEGTWYLEASIAVQTGGTATCTLKGGSVIGSITQTNATMEAKRSTALTMPAVAENIWVTLKTNNSSYTASLGGARLIYVP